MMPALARLRRFCPPLPLLVTAVTLPSHRTATDKSKIRRCRPDAVSSVASRLDARPSSEDGWWLVELAPPWSAPPPSRRRVLDRHPLCVCHDAAIADAILEQYPPKLFGFVWMQSSAENDTLPGPSAEIGSCHFCLRGTQEFTASAVLPSWPVRLAWYRVAAEPREKGSCIRFGIVVRLPCKSHSIQSAGSSAVQCLDFGVFRIFFEMWSAVILSVPVIL